MIHIIKCLQDHHHNDLIKYCQDYGDVQEILSYTQKAKGTQEIMTGSFSFGITKA